MRGYDAITPLRIIIELVDSISRDGPDMPYMYKKVNISEQINLTYIFMMIDLHQNSYLSSPEIPMETIRYA